MFDVYLIQHGPQADAREDIEEGLSENGKKIVKESAAGLKRLGCDVDTIFCSPKKRSIETGQLISEGLGMDKSRCVVHESFAPMAPATHAIEFIKSQGVSRFLIAGHLPSLVELGSFLMCDGCELNLGFERGAGLYLQCEDLISHNGRLIWLFPRFELK